MLYQIKPNLAHTFCMVLTTPKTGTAGHRYGTSCQAHSTETSTHLIIITIMINLRASGLVDNGSICRRDYARAETSILGACAAATTQGPKQASRASTRPKNQPPTPNTQHPTINPKTKSAAERGRASLQVQCRTQCPKKVLL